jgi:hypothetical protein
MYCGVYSAMNPTTGLFIYFAPLGYVKPFEWKIQNLIRLNAGRYQPIRNTSNHNNMFPFCKSGNFDMNRTVAALCRHFVHRI